jgi:hypothetical protein
VTGPEFSLEAARWSVLIFQEILARMLNHPADTTAAASPMLWTIKSLPDGLVKPPQLSVTAADVAASANSGHVLLLSAVPDLDIVLTDPTGRTNYSMAGGHIHLVSVNPATPFSSTLLRTT